MRSGEAIDRFAIKFVTILAIVLLALLVRFFLG